MAAWNSERRKVFVISGAQAGKTIFGPPWLYREIQRHGEGDYLAVTSNYDLFRLKMLPVMREYFEDLLGIGKYWAGAGMIEIASPTHGFLAKNQSDRMWARIILRSAVAQGGLESATAKAAWIDECGMASFKYEAWEAVQRRLTLNQGRVLGTTTPYNLGWLKTEIYDRFVEGDTGIDVISFPSIWNPMFPKEEYERARLTMPDWRFKMFYNGEFARPAGMIYECFDTATMTYDPRQLIIPEGQGSLLEKGKVCVGLDFGGANTALLWLWLQPSTGIWHVFDESISGNKSTQDHAAGVKTQAKKYAKVEYYGGAFSETQYRMDWNKACVTVQRPFTDDVEIGISSVIELFKDGKLKISRDCKVVLNELGTYSRKLDEYNQPINVIQNKEAYHLLDCLRYAGVTINGGGSWSIAPSQG